MEYLYIFLAIIFRKYAEEYRIDDYNMLKHNHMIKNWGNLRIGVEISTQKLDGVSFSSKRMRVLLSLSSVAHCTGVIFIVHKKMPPLCLHRCIFRRLLKFDISMTRKICK